MIDEKESMARKKPTTIDEYFDALDDDDQREALEKLRKTIKSVAPKVEECISYGLAAFRLNGKLVAGLGTSKNHCAFYPMSGSIVEKFKDELKGFETSKGTIRFRPDKPLSAALVKKLVKARMAESSNA